MGLLKSKAPNLPTPATVYSQDQQQQRDNALRLYFNQLDSANWDGVKVVNPFGSFYSNSTQTATSTTAAYSITFSNTDISNNVSLSDSSRLNVIYTGIYNLQFSLQLSNSDNTPADIDVWLKKNGTNVDDTNARFGLSQRKSVGDPFHIVGSLNLFIKLKERDYIELSWCTTNLLAEIKYYAAGTSPTRPEIPSVIATLSWVSAIP